MHRNDYIPRTDQGFLEWAISFLNNLRSRLARLLFPQEVFDRLEEKTKTFAEAFEVSHSPGTRTSVSILKKNVARKALESDFRQTVGEYLSRNHLLTDDDRNSLGLRVRKRTRTPAPVAESYPDFDIDSSMLCRLRVHFFERGGSHKRAKPPGQHGAEIAWVISDVPIEKTSDLLHSSFDTRTPFSLEFEGDQRGKTVYLALRWENTRGQKGHWSPIKNAIIP
jgi:hypothetical protein